MDDTIAMAMVPRALVGTQKWESIISHGNGTFKIYTKQVNVLLLQKLLSNTTTNDPEAVLPLPRVSASAAWCCNSWPARAPQLQRDSWPETWTTGNSGADMLQVRDPHGATLEGKGGAYKAGSSHMVQLKEVEVFIERVCHHIILFFSQHYPFSTILSVPRRNPIL